MNRLYLQDLVKGAYGRKIAYTNVPEITVKNIVKVVGECLGVFYYNKPVIKYLWNYYKGDQPIRYRRKLVRDDIVNKIVENHAWEIVRFKVQQTYGEPIQYVSRGKSKELKTSKYVDILNQYMKDAFKQKRDIDAGKWQSAVGTSFKAVQRTKDGSPIPFRIIVPSPMNTFIIYSKSTEEPMLAVQELKDEYGQQYKLCFSDNMQFTIKNGKVVDSRLHAFGGIPIVEYPNNMERISDIELVIDLFDAINNMQSNRMDAIEQFVQSWVKFINCEVDEEQFRKMKQEGALVVKSNNGTNNKADVDVMTQELSQTESQIAKEDLWNNALSISAIPNKEGNTGGDTQGAVELRNGWDFSKGAAKLQDPTVEESEKRLGNVILNVIRIAKGDCPITIRDYDVKIHHSPLDNMLVKAQFLDYLLKDGVHPEMAFERSTLFSDSEQAYLKSKPYLDVLYKTINEVTEQQAGQEFITQINN